VNNGGEAAENNSHAQYRRPARPPRPEKRQILRLRQCAGGFMKKYECTVCGYVYDEELGDPDNGVAPGTKWEDVPDSWVCPLCGVGKDMFEEA